MADTESIFLAVKESLGVEATYTGFDASIRMYINTAITNLKQLGIGPEDGLVVTDSDQQWHQLIGTAKDYENVKTYICLSVRLMFDPPANSTVLTAFTQMLQELAWRINAQYETDLTKPTPTT